MSEEYDEVEDCYPRTLRDAVDCFLSLDLTESDEDVICNTPPERLDWLHANFERSIRRCTGLDAGNTTLIHDCCAEMPNASAHDASRVIMEAVRVLYQTGVYPD